MNPNTFILVFAIGFGFYSAISAIRAISHSHDRKDRLLIFLGGIALVNWSAFMIADIVMGGSAFAGRIEGGHYFLGDHGSYTEVSRTVFVWSAIHTTSAILGLVLVGIASNAWKRARAT